MSYFQHSGSETNKTSIAIKTKVQSDAQKIQQKTTKDITCLLSSVDYLIVIFNDWPWTQSVTCVAEHFLLNIQLKLQLANLLADINSKVYAQAGFDFRVLVDNSFTKTTI